MEKHYTQSLQLFLPRHLRAPLLGCEVNNNKAKQQTKCPTNFRGFGQGLSFLQVTELHLPSARVL